MAVVRYYYSVTEAQKVGVSHVNVGGRWVRFTAKTSDPKYKSCYPDCKLAHTGTGKETIQSPKK